jgi:hypothetical protein
MFFMYDRKFYIEKSNLEKCATRLQKIGQVSKKYIKIGSITFNLLLIKAILKFLHTHSLLKQKHEKRTNLGSLP